MLLLLFALLAGAATAVSPCVLPVLPVALSAGITGGRRRPLGVVAGLALSFTFATVLLVYVIDALDLPDELARDLAIAVLIGFGVTLLVPPLADRVEALLTRVAPAAPRVAGDGFGSGLALGAALGFVYAPCAGPILAAVITATASQDFGAGRLAVALAYGIGTAAVLYALLIGGRRLTRPLARHSARFQAAIGVVMIAFGLAMLGELDIRFENAIADDLPSAIVNPTASLERSGAVSGDLDALRPDRRALVAPGAQARRAPSDLPRLAVAPDFEHPGAWLNTGGRQLTLAGLRGRVVLLDFWTYSCINCLRTLPYLRAWDARYRDKGLTIVGVHTPEFPFERSTSNVRSAIARNGVRYPVVQDNDYGTWNAYGNDSWPAHYLIDADGYVRSFGVGEGAYEELEDEIRSLLREARGGDLGSPAAAGVSAEQPSFDLVTPESYLGAARAANFVRGPREGSAEYGSPPARLGADELAYSGTWKVGPEYATAGAGAGLDLNFRARRVFLVLGSPVRARSVQVLLDGRPVPARLSGSDVKGAAARVRFERLYRLIELPRVERHRLSLRFPAGVRGYAFTFG